MQELEKNNSFTHFKIHTQYSICEGAIKIDNLKDFCKANKVKALGISDSFNLCGALEFSEAISKQGTQPIIGTQIAFKYGDTTGKLTLIASSEIGYKRIIELSSKSYLEKSETHEPLCFLDDLLLKPEGIIVMSNNINGLIGKLFLKNRFKEIEEIYNKLKISFNFSFYLEIQRHDDLNEKQFERFNLKTSYDLKIPIIASHEVFYLDKSMHEAHETLICIGNKTYLNDKNRLSYSNNHYFKSDHEMFELFRDLPEAIENNVNLPFRCSYRPTPSKPMLPNIKKTNNDDTETELTKYSLNGLDQKFQENPYLKNNYDKYHSIYKLRLNHELEIIKKMKYASYFLIVADYINWAKGNDIPVGPGRGSGAGSLVAWCLSITDVDPIKFNLIFERFLNPSRISLPDFDIDFCEEKRDLVFDYLSKKYKDSVAHIITFGKLKARMVIRDVGRVLGLSYGFIDNIAKMIPFDPSRPQNLQECINSEPRLQNLIKTDKRIKRLIDLSLKLEGLNRNVATHAAGVVIADRKLTDTVPLYKDHSTDLLLPSTQFDMYSAENAGLIKFDFLGLKTLTVINKTQKLINNSNKEFDINKISYEDSKVFNTLSSGNTVGLFQLESSGMKDALINMKPTELEDIIALVALYRPGPMSNIPIYNECKNNNREPDYIHPLLEEILRPTYGVIIYQEQVMQIAQKLSGFSAAEADILRKAIGKKKRSEVEKQKMRFIEGAVKNGISKDVAAGIFLKIEPFAEYGFNKSHAAAYAIIAYQTAFLKTHYPNEFFAASMTMDISNQKKLAEFYEEINRLKIKVIRPNINSCFADFRSDQKNFYYALGSIKNVGYEAISNIVEERIKNGKFLSIENFINRVNPKDINKLQLEGLVKSGAFDEIYENRSALFNSIPKLILKSKSVFENKEANQIDLFGDNFQTNDQIVDKNDEWIFEEKLKMEFEAVGFFISNHPLNQYKELYNDFNIINYENFVNNNELKNSNIAATILKIQEKKTGKGTSYAIVKFSDLSRVFEIFIFSEILEKNRNILIEGNSVIINLIKSITDDDKKTKKINILNISSIKEIYNKPINKIEFMLDHLSKMEDLSRHLDTLGNTEVIIKYKFKQKYITLNLQNRRYIDRKIVNSLKKQQIQSIIH